MTSTPDHPMDVLLAAATAAEEIADAATPGPWVSLDRGDRLIRDTGDDGPLEYVVGEPVEHEGNAAHIVLWQPPVARAVAVWLRACADLHEQTYEVHRVLGKGCQWCNDEDWPCSDMRHALAVARALLTAKDNT